MTNLVLPNSSSVALPQQHVLAAAPRPTDDTAPWGYQEGTCK